MILLSICPILTSADEGPINGYIVLGANFTEKKIADIGEELNSEIKLTFLKDFEYDRKFFDLANCQVKCDTSCKKTSIADFQPRHFRGLELIRNRLCISSISFTRERSVFLG